MHRPSPLLIILPLIAGCALFKTDKGDWSKPGVSDEQTASDLGTCRDGANAQVAAEERIQRDVGNTAPLASPGPPPIGGSLQSNLAQFQLQQRFDLLVRNCMTRLGYIQGAKGAT
jgi:hypothetical protein